MSDIKYTKITIPTKEENIEILTSKLTDLGAEGFEITGDSDLREMISLADPDMIDDDVRGLCNRATTITVYIPDNGQGEKIVRDIGIFLESENSTFLADRVNESDWENNWKQYFKPIEIGRRLVIKPTWDEYDNIDNRKVLEIDPSGAFGTGQHATTMMCLEILEKSINGGESIVDVGCGSGILSAAAMLLGARNVSCIDICETAIKVTNETFSLNSISGHKTYCGNLISDKSLQEEVGDDFDIAIANITADVIIAMGNILKNLTKNVLILSGIIAPRLNEVRAVIEPNFAIIETNELEGWNSLICVKR